MRQFIKDNWEEFAVYGIVGLGFFPIIGWNALPLGIATGILGRMGGSGIWPGKIYRRFGVPLVLIMALNSIPMVNKLLPFVLSVVLLSMGYGSRSTQPYDPGSPLGNLMLRLFGERLGKIVSRATIIVGMWGVWYTALNWR